MATSKFNTPLVSVNLNNLSKEFQSKVKMAVRLREQDLHEFIIDAVASLAENYLHGKYGASTSTLVSGYELASSMSGLI